MNRGRELVDQIVGTLQTCVERGFVERNKDDGLTFYLEEQGLIKKLSIEGESPLYEATTEGKRFLALVLEIKQVAEKFAANGCSSGNNQ